MVRRLSNPPPPGPVSASAPDPEFAVRGACVALVGFALGLAAQGVILASLRPAGLWYLATALLPLHVGAAGGVCLALRLWPSPAALLRAVCGRVSAASLCRVLLVLLGLGILVSLLHGLSLTLCRRVHLETPPSALFPLLAGGGSRAAVAALVLLLWVPLCEEVLFRWVLPDALAAARIAHPGACSAALFALAHGMPAHVPGLLLLGLGLQHLRRRHGGLWAPILAHALYNAGALTWWLVAASAPAGPP